MKANYTLDLQRTTIKPTEVRFLNFAGKLLVLLRNRIMWYVITCTVCVDANPTTGKNVRGIIVDFVILLPITKHRKIKQREERQGLKTKGKKEGPQCVCRQCPHIILAASLI